jgi:hypothetical protein
LTFIFPNNKVIQQEMLIVKDLPEPILLGRDWGSKAGAHVLLDEKKCVSEKAGFCEPFVEKEKYDKFIQKEQQKAAKEVMLDDEKQKELQAAAMIGLSKSEAEERIFY